MTLSRWIVGVGMAGLLAIGCDRPKQPPTASETPAETSAADPAVQASTRQQPSTRPANSHIIIDRQMYDFPPARLQLTRRDEAQTRAALFSDDPRDAIRPDFSGNSYYFEMSLDVDPADVTSDSWSYKATTSERQDTVNGIFLIGSQVHLQPFDVRGEFEGDLANLTIHINGYFLAFRNDAQSDTGQMVLVSAELPVIPEVK